MTNENNVIANTKANKTNKKTSENKRRKPAEGFTIKELLGDLEIKF